MLAILLGGLFLSNTYTLPFPHIRNFTFYKSEVVAVSGVVADFPRVESNFSSFVLSARELTWAGKIYPVRGKILVRVFRRQGVSYGDRLILEGKLFRPYLMKNSRFSYRDYLESQGIYSILTVSKDKPIKYLGRGRINPLKFLAYRIRDKSEDILFNNLKPTQASILSAMILGERGKIPSHLRRLFIQTGTVHILAISGLHVGIVIFILGLLLKVLRLRRRARYLTIILLLIFYCLLTGARPSVIRATIMAIILLAGFLLRRQMRFSYSLALAALIILVVNPRQLFNPGFQLSFISVISIVYLSPRIRKFFDTAKTFILTRIPVYSMSRLQPGRAQKSARARRSGFRGFEAILNFAGDAVSVSLAAWLGAFPFVIYYFKIVTPIALLANLLVVPCLALVVALGFSLLFAGIIFPVLAPVFAAPANLSVIALIQVIGFFNQIPCAYFYL